MISPRRRCCEYPTRRAALLLLPLLAAAALPVFPAAYAHKRDVLPDYVPDGDTLTRAAKDAVVELLPDGFAVVAPEPFAEPQPATDSRYGWHFSRAVYIYAPPRPGEARGLFRRVVVHHEPEARANALNVARLIARLQRLHRQHLRRDTQFYRDADIAHVWLAPEKPGNGTAGGETHDNQMYIFATGTFKRTALEWTRTVVHEWGHVTLPAARGYTEPENDAAGYLGERLYLKWLYEEASRKGAPANDGTALDDLTLYYRRQIAPLMARFRTPESGPYAKTLSGNFTENMDYYIGMALAFDNTFGSALLGRAIFSIDGNKPQDLRAAMESTLADIPSFTVSLPGWVPLARGRYSLTTEKGSSGSIALSDRPPLAVRGGQSSALRTLLPGWKWTRAASGNIKTVTLRREAGS